MAKYIHESDYFFGNKISDYGIKHGYVDYRTLANSFDLILNNDIITKNIGYWEMVNGSDVFYTNKETNDIINDIDDIDDYNNVFENYIDIYQYYIISDNGAKILREYTDEIVYYNEELDIYLWGVTHFGTSWDYVLTDIEICLEGEQ